MSENEGVGPVETTDEETHPVAVGPIVDTPEATEAEQKDAEYRENRRLPGPGDEDYDPKLDKLLPNTVLIEQVEIEMRNSDGKASPTWEALYAEWEKANPEVDEDAELVEDDENDES